jgi:hypothetical protein
MTTPDPWWDELGFAWTAAPADPQAALPGLTARLRRQAWLLRLLIAGAALASLAGLALAGWTLWLGWTAHVWHFLVRGTAVLVLAILLAAAAGALAGSVRDASRSLAEALDVAVRRAQGRRRALALGVWACALAAAFGTAGYFVRSYFTRPPAMSPLEPLLVLALTALVLLLLARAASRDLARTRHLQRALAGEE